MSSTSITVPRNESAIKAKTIYDDFGLVEATEALQEKSRSNFLSMLAADGAVASDAIAGLNKFKQYVVEIPPEFLDGLKEGKLIFDKSNKIPGNFTPNIRGEDGTLVGQATIKNGIDPKCLTSGLANLAMFAMMAKISQQISELTELVQEIKKGQEDNRRASVISGFKEFYSAYMSDPNHSDTKMVAIIAYSKMNEGLTQIHLEISSFVDKNFKKAPKNNFMAFIYGYTRVKKYRNRFRLLEQKLNEFQYLEMLTEIVCYFAQGWKSVEQKHLEFSNFITRLFEDETLMSKSSCSLDTPRSDLYISKLYHQERENQYYLATNNSAPQINLVCISGELSIQ